MGHGIGRGLRSGDMVDSEGWSTGSSEEQDKAAPSLQRKEPEKKSLQSLYIAWLYLVNTAISLSNEPRIERS